MASYPYRTVVDAAAMSRNLVDATTVFAEIGVASPTSEQTTQMETVIAQVSALIDGFLDRTLAEEDVTDHFRSVSGDTLRLSRWPVDEILEVIEAGAALTPDDWELDTTTGQLWRLSGGEPYCWATSGATTVSYIGGYILPDDLPADIQRAAIDQVKTQYLGGTRDPAVRSFDVPGVYSASFSVAGGDSYSGGLMTQVEAALRPYRRIVV